jgi:hypothetical protein
MRAVILALLGGVIFAAASAQAAPPLRKASAPEVGTAPPVELVAQDAATAGIATTGVTTWATGTAGSAFRTLAGAQGWNILMKIGEVPQGALVIHRDRFLDTARRLAAKDRNGHADPEDVTIRTSGTNAVSPTSA